ncbi:IucA/IucC family protein [Flindersiella endophytica]
MSTDAHAVAHQAAAENLLRCWVRETGVTRPAGGVLELELTASGTRLSADVSHWSASGWHRFGEVRLNGVPVVDAATVSALLAREAAARQQVPAYSGASLVERVLDSARRVATHVAARQAAVEPPAQNSLFLNAEQALLLGHPLHPTPKSRESLTDSEAAECSPELRGSFPLHWFAADESIVSQDSALPDSAAGILAALSYRCLDVPAGTVAIPAHPWQARDLVRRPGITGLLEKDLLRDLGPCGPPWYPTSSLRTVYRPDAPAMLKLSLGVRITNSRRENLRKELLRGVEVHRLLEAGLGRLLHAEHPTFDIVRDPAWLAVDLPGDPPDCTYPAPAAYGRTGPPHSSGLDVIVRANPFRLTDRVSCIAGLVAEQPGIGPSALGNVVRELAARTGDSLAATSAEWLRRYLDVVIRPVLWLYATHGIALEAHQQNTLVLLDSSGWPVGGRYRDNQGYYFASSRVGALQEMLPKLGVESDTTVPDEVADERLGYYLGVNNLLGLIGAFGSQGLADESDLLRVAHAQLSAVHQELGERPATLTTLLTSKTLRCKANLLTRLHEMDELVGPVSTQSVYVTIANPLVEAAG